MTAMLPRVQRLARPDYTCDLDATLDEVHSLLDLAADVKRSPGSYRSALGGKSIALLFEKPSLRTRMTFELAIQQLGGFALFDVGPIGVREPLKDIARNLDRWVSGIVARTFHQQTIDDLALWSSVPVINALSDLWHPCQALADMQTIQEHFGELRGLKLAFIGDGNNVASSLMLDATRLGMKFSIATPEGSDPAENFVEWARANGGRVKLTRSASEAVADADCVVTDTWYSMGQEHRARGHNVFKPYQVDARLMAQARPDAIFMHCLPAHRGEEVTDEVIDGPHSVVFDEAENRLHAQKAVLAWCLAR
jgi:ornithine carbamoyltransferase